MNDFERNYRAMNPEISLSFPIATEKKDFENELISGYQKVLRGFRVLNELCAWAILARKSGRLHSIGSNSSEESFFEYCELYDDFAYRLADDAATVTRRLVDFIPGQSLDLMALYREVMDYLQLYFEENRLWGDFEDRIGGALLHLAMLDSTIENELYVAWILDLNDPASERSNEYYSFVFEHLNKQLLMNVDENKALVERIYVGPLVVSIVATDDDVEFLVDGWEEDRLKGEWDDDYKYGQIYRNDKQAPSQKEEWLALMAPEEGHGFKLGTRSYKSFEDAIKGETAWLSAVGHYFR